MLKLPYRVTTYCGYYYVPVFEPFCCCAADAEVA